MIESDLKSYSYSALLQRDSKPLFLPPNSTSLIPSWNTARDQLVSKKSPRKQRRSNGQRTERILFAYYAGHRKLGCWKSRRTKLRELSKKHGRGFSLRNLTRLDRRLREQGFIQSSTGWGSRGRRSTNRHMITRKPRGWKHLRILNGQGILLRPSGHKDLKKKPINPPVRSRPQSGAQTTGLFLRGIWERRKQFSYFNPKNFKPRLKFYRPGHIKRCKDYLYRVKFWNSCQKYFELEKRKYFKSQRPKPRFNKTWQEYCYQERIRVKGFFNHFAERIKLRDKIHGHYMVKKFREMGQDGFFKWYKSIARGRHWLPFQSTPDDGMWKIVGPNYGPRMMVERFLRMYLWVHRHEGATC